MLLIGSHGSKGLGVIRIKFKSCLCSSVIETRDLVFLSVKWVMTIF